MRISVLRVGIVEFSMLFGVILILVCRLWK